MAWGGVASGQSREWRRGDGEEGWRERIERGDGGGYGGSSGSSQGLCLFIIASSANTYLQNEYLVMEILILLKAVSYSQNSPDILLVCPTC